MSPEALGRVFAELLAGAGAATEERLDRIEQRLAKLEVQRAETSAGWMSPPMAAKALGRKVGQIRALVKSGKVESRVRNLDPSSKSKKYEVNVASLERALRGEVRLPEAEPGKPIDATAWAAQRLAKAAP